MKKIDFEAAQPPVIAEEELRRLARERILRKQMITVFIGTLLTLVAMLILSAAAFAVSPRLGAVTLALPLYTVLWGGTLVFLFVFVKRRGEDGKRPFFNQKVR